MIHENTMSIHIHICPPDSSSGASACRGASQDDRPEAHGPGAEAADCSTAGKTEMMITEAAALLVRNRR